MCGVQIKRRLLQTAFNIIFCSSTYQVIVHYSFAFGFRILLKFRSTFSHNYRSAFTAFLLPFVPHARYEQQPPLLLKKKEKAKMNRVHFPRPATKPRRPLQQFSLFSTSKVFGAVGVCEMMRCAWRCRGRSSRSWSFWPFPWCCRQKRKRGISHLLPVLRNASALGGLWDACTWIWLKFPKFLRRQHYCKSIYKHLRFKRKKTEKLLLLLLLYQLF